MQTAIIVSGEHDIYVGYRYARVYYTCIMSADFMQDHAYLVFEVLSLNFVPLTEIFLAEVANPAVSTALLQEIFS